MEIAQLSKSTHNNQFQQSTYLSDRRNMSPGNTMTLHTEIPNQCPYQVKTSFTLQFPRYNPEIFLSSRSNLCHFITLQNHIPQPMSTTNYEVPTPYSFQDITQRRSHQGHTMTLHTYIPQPMFPPSVTSYTLQFLRYTPGQDIFSHHIPIHPAGYHR